MSNNSAVLNNPKRIDRTKAYSSTLAKPPWAVVSYLVSLSKLSTAPAFAVGGQDDL